MDSLYQRLKELDSDTFERLCLHLLKERHPGADIRHVDGKGGDEGIDHFEGDLTGEPTVWQCKAFPNGIREAQKRQIRDSLSRAIRTCSPRQWILCTNIDFDIKAHRWYQKLTQQYAGSVQLGLLQAGDIVPQLIHYRTVRNHFFPDACLDVKGLRALITRTVDLTDGELQKVTEENMDQLLQRIKDRDARFNYDITRSLDCVAENEARIPGAVFSLKTGPTTIRGFARDVEALRRNPPKVRLSLQKAGASKFLTFIETGKGQDIAVGEIRDFSTDLPIGEFVKGHPEALAMQMSQISNRELPLRLKFGDGQSAVVYDHVPCKIARAGTKEVELITTGPVPFKMSMVLQERGGSFHVTDQPIGAEVRELRKYMDAMHVIAETHIIECYDLASDRKLFRAQTPDIHMPDYWAAGFEKFVRETSAIADEFEVSLCLPQRLTENDIEASIILDAILHETPISLEAVTLTIVKSAENERLFLETLNQGFFPPLRTPKTNRPPSGGLI